MKFSVLMSVYAKERPEHLKQALQSLLDQTLKADEVVLVEDGPIGTDLSRVIEDFRQELHITSVQLDTNQGLAVALNEGLKHCSYELVARMDSDDIALPERFALQVAFMEAHPEVAVSSGLIEEFDSAGRILSVRKLPLINDQIRIFSKTRNPISHPAAIFRKDAVLAVGGYPRFRTSQDHALWSMLLVKGYVLANIDTKLLKMRAGTDLMKRRGFNYFLQELKILKFQREIGFINRYTFIKNVLIRLAIRIPPGYVKEKLYKYIR